MMHTNTQIVTKIRKRFPGKIVKRFGKHGKHQKPTFKGEEPKLAVWINQELADLVKKTDTLVFDILIEPDENEDD